MIKKKKTRLLLKRFSESGTGKSRPIAALPSFVSTRRRLRSFSPDTARACLYSASLCRARATRGRFERSRGNNNRSRRLGLVHTRVTNEQERERGKKRNVRYRNILRTKCLAVVTPLGGRGKNLIKRDTSENNCRTYMYIKVHMKLGNRERRCMSDA